MRIKNLLVLLLISTVASQQMDLTSPGKQEQLYIKLFKRRRAEQLEAVKSFRKITNYEKQYNMIILMAEKIFEIVLQSRAHLEASGFIPGTSQFPNDPQTRDALSNILENVALFSEITLRFPEISIKVLRFNNHWDILLQWGIAFANQVNYLLDSSTVKLLDLVSQELNHTARNPNYVNPYRKSAKINDTMDNDRAKVERKKKRKEIKKGPRLTGHFEL